LNVTVTETIAERRAARLGLWLVLSNMAAAVLLAGLLALWISDSRRAAIARAQDKAGDVARMLAGGIQGDIARIDLGLQSLVTAYARAPERGFAPDSPLGIALADLRAVMPEADALLATDAQGAVRLGRAADTPPLRLGERDFFVAARTAPGTSPVLSEPWRLQASGKWMLSVARALRNSDGTFAGVVHADLSSELFARRFADVSIGQEGVISLRTGAMALVARVTPQGIVTEGLGRTSISPQIRAALAANPLSGTFQGRAVTDGVERAGAYQRVDGHALYVLVGSGTEEYPSQLTWPQSASRGASMSTP
jgi:hypothetical protein